MTLHADDTLDLAPSRWVYLGEDGWRHQPRWKVAANTVLRLIQRGRPRCWLFVSSCVNGPDGPLGRPACIGYGFARVVMTHIETALPTSSRPCAKSIECPQSRGV